MWIFAVALAIKDFADLSVGEFRSRRLLHHLKNLEFHTLSIFLKETQAMFRPKIQEGQASGKSAFCFDQIRDGSFCRTEIGLTCNTERRSRNRIVLVVVLVLVIEPRHPIEDEDENADDEEKFVRRAKILRDSSTDRLPLQSSDIYTRHGMLIIQFDLSKILNTVSKIDGIPSSCLEAAANDAYANGRRRATDQNKRLFA